MGTNLKKKIKSQINKRHEIFPFNAGSFYPFFDRANGPFLIFKPKKGFNGLH